MNSQQSNLPYVFSTIGNVIILTFLPVFFYFVLLFATSDIGGPLNLVLIPCSNLIASILFTLAFFYPFSKLLDLLFQKVSQNGQSRINSFILSAVVSVLILVLIVGGLIFAIGVILEKPFAFQILGEQDIDSVMVWLLRFLFLGGVPFLLGGSMYWFLLQSSRKVLSNRKQEQGLSDQQKAG